MNGGWVKGREGMREERGSKGQGMEGDEGEGKNIVSSCVQLPLVMFVHDLTL